MANSTQLKKGVPIVGGIACALLFVVLHRVIYNRLEVESLELLVGGTVMPLFSALAIGLLAGYYVGMAQQKSEAASYFLSGLFLTILVEFLALSLSVSDGLNLALLASLAFVVFISATVSGLSDGESLIGTILLTFVVLSVVWIIFLALTYYLLPVFRGLEEWRRWPSDF